MVISRFGDSPWTLPDQLLWVLTDFLKVIPEIAFTLIEWTEGGNLRWEMTTVEGTLESYVQLNKNHLLNVIFKIVNYFKCNYVTSIFCVLCCHFNKLTNKRVLFICSRLNNRFPSVTCYLLSTYLCISHKVKSAVFLVTVVLLAIFRGICEECSAILNGQVYFRNSTTHDHPPLDFS